MSKRFELINLLNAHDKFRDNDNNKELDSFDVIDLLNCYDKLQILLTEKDQQIAELEEQLKNARKETAKRVIDRVEEFSVFDFKAYEEHDLRKYTITELALDVILREFQGENK